MKNKLFRESLLLQYFSIFLFVSILPLIFSSYFIIQHQTEESVRQVFAQLDSVATIKENRVQEWVKSMKDDLAAIVEINQNVNSQLLMLLNSSDKQNNNLKEKKIFQKTMQEMLIPLNKFDELFVLSKDGIILGSSNISNIGAFRGKQIYFSKGILKAGSFVQSFSLSSRAEGLNTVITILPIRNKFGGEILGLFCARASLKYLDNIMFSHTGMGKSGETILIGENHVLLSGSRFENFPSGMTYIRNIIIDNTILNQVGFNDVFKDYRNQEVVGVSKWVPELKTVLISKQDSAEVYQGIKKSIIISIFIVVIAIGGAVFISIYFSRRIIEPINVLSATAQRIADGELNLRVDLNLNNELGSLGKSFNQMTESLNEKMIESKKNIESLLIAREEAEKATALKARFLDIAAHELRTPVTAFSLLLQLTQKQLENGKPVDASVLIRLRGQANRIANLVVDLLDVSRLERGTITLNLELYDLNLIITDCIADLELRESGRSIKYTKFSEKIELRIDVLRITQVITNILENARKYTPKDSPIEIIVEKKESKCLISITDHGPGISESQQSVLFTPFTRGTTDLTSRSGGLGLGLYISREIIKLHSGTISLVSKMNSGSIFTIELPLS